MAAKIMNVVFGIGIAVILYIVVLLGINVFYPGPDWQDYNCSSFEARPVEIQVCNPNMTVGDCYMVVAGKQLSENRTLKEKELEECNQKFQKDNEAYGRNFFYIANIVGVLIVTAGLLLFIYLASMINLAVGSAFAGLALIFFGFITGWQSTSDKLKFVLGLIIAVIIITFSVIVNKKYQGKK